MTCCCTSTLRMTSMTSRVTMRWPISTAMERWPECPTHTAPARWPCSAGTATSRCVTMFLPQYCLATVVTRSPLCLARCRLKLHYQFDYCCSSRLRLISRKSKPTKYPMWHANSFVHICAFVFMKWTENSEKIKSFGSELLNHTSELPWHREKTVAWKSRVIDRCVPGWLISDSARNRPV